jgi:hypothetical protein
MNKMGLFDGEEKAYSSIIPSVVAAKALDLGVKDAHKLQQFNRRHGRIIGFIVKDEKMNNKFLDRGVESVILSAPSGGLVSLNEFRGSGELSFEEDNTDTVYLNLPVEDFKRMLTFHFAEQILQDENTHTNPAIMRQLSELRPNKYGLGEIKREWKSDNKEAVVNQLNVISSSDAEAARSGKEFDNNPTNHLAEILRKVRSK